MSGPVDLMGKFVSLWQKYTRTHTQTHTDTYTHTQDSNKKPHVIPDVTDVCHLDLALCPVSLCTVTRIKDTALQSDFIILSFSCPERSSFTRQLHQTSPKCVRRAAGLSYSLTSGFLTSFHSPASLIIFHSFERWKQSLMWCSTFILWLY